MAELLKKLCTLNGVSGNEKDVRDFIVSYIAPYADDIRIDSLGNIISYKKGKKGKKTLLLAANMDEVGFIVSKITDEGFIKFKAVGDIDPRNIVSKCIKINNEIDGVLGMKAIHLQKRDEREKTVAIKDLYIDIGAKNKEKAQKCVKLGNYISFSSEYFETENRILSKALDSRIGCMCLIELIKNEYDDDIYFVFTTQREVGMRGASVAAYGLNIDAALVIEGFESSDMYKACDYEVTADLGKGICIDFMDKYAIPDKSLTHNLKTALEAKNVPVQPKKNAAALTDAGAIQRSADGVVTACIGVPVRYSHTPLGMADKRDIAALKLAAEIFIRKSEDII